MDVFDLYAKLSLDSSGYETGLTDAKRSFESFGDNLNKGSSVFGDMLKANLVTKGIDVAIDGIKKLGEVTVGMVSQSVQAFGDYEQLKGGVETLFGDSAQKVLDNANRAFEQAGMSTNQYMETSIQSAAALINSLSGDQAKAAELMNMSITDMADNVNKMGTTMEGVQNAYRGFSRGNFTMLDNLALGFAGTKEGMQQLLDKAHELSGVKYDISSYADIVNAIHVVQEEMGITGTTAKEAAGTIQGSMNALKSAWENLVAGFANPDADLGQLISNVVDSGITVLDNIIPVIERALEGIGTALEKIVPIITEKLPEIVSKVLPPLIDAVLALVKGIVAALPSMIEVLLDAIFDVIDAILAALPDIIQALAEAIPKIVKTLITKLMENLPTIIQGIIDVVLAIVDALPTIIVGLIEALPDIIESVLTAIIESLPIIIEGLITLVMKIVEHLPEIIEALIEALPRIIEVVVVTLVENFPKIIVAIVEGLAKLLGKIIEWLGTLINKIGEWFGDLINRIGEWIQGIWNGIADFFSNAWELGKNLVEGIWNGIVGAAKWLWEKITGWLSDIWQGIKDFFGIQSPSKKMGWIGDMMVEGLAGSISDKGRKALTAAQKLNKEITDAMDMKANMDISSNIESADASDYYDTDGYGDDYEEYVVSRTGQEESRDMTIILELDGVQLARTIYKLNNQETQRVGLRLAGAFE